MGNVRTIYLDWNTGAIKADGGAYLARQYDHLSNLVIFENAPQLENYYLLVEMKNTDDDFKAVEQDPIMLAGAYWLIPNSYTQLIQPVSFQICCKTESGDFEQHSAKFTLNVIESMGHTTRKGVDPSVMFDPYKQMLDDRVNELLDESGKIVVDGEVAANAVSSWLNNHPEATTTVQDGSLTESKFSDSLKLKAVKDYVTPQMFGAVGNGIIDDTTALQNALDSGKTLYVLPGRYRITRPITAHNRLNMLLDSQAEIYADPVDTMDYLIGVKNDGGAYTNTYGDCIAGGVLNGNNKCKVIVGLNYVVQGCINSVNIKNFTQCGVYVRHNIISTGGSGSCFLKDCRIENDTPIANTYGVYDAGTDNVYDSIVVKNANVGMLVNSGSVAKSCHVWQSGNNNFDTSAGFLLRGNLGALSDCISDTMRYGIVTDSDYVKFSICNFIYYFNEAVTNAEFLNAHTPVVFNFYSNKQFFAVSNANINLSNSEGKIISDNAIGSQTIIFTAINANGMNNAIAANIPYDITRFDARTFLKQVTMNGNITKTVLDAELTTSIRGGYISYDSTYTGWGIIITIQSNESTVIQTMMIAGKAAVTRRYANGSWGNFS